MTTSMCQMCHLGPGVGPTPVHTDLNPKPPRLNEEVAHNSPQNLFWIVKHGINMTGMPAWGETHSDEEIWEVVAFVKQRGQMTPAQYKKLTQGAGGSSSTDGSHAHEAPIADSEETHGSAHYLGMSLGGAW